jgi:8-oxo-dGTP pyrophosphatase MutT (NUDIX family)
MSSPVAPEHDKVVASLVVAAICVARSRFVLVQRAVSDPFRPGKWSVPAGHVHRAESLDDAVRREVLEETGLRVEEPRLIGAVTYDEIGDEGRLEFVLQLNYIVACADAALAPRTQDVSAAQWVAPDQFDKMGLDGFTRAVLAQAAGTMAWGTGAVP